MKFRSLPRLVRIMVIIILVIIFPSLIYLQTDTILGLDITPHRILLVVLSVLISIQVFLETDPELYSQYSFFRYSRKDGFVLLIAFLILLISISIGWIYLDLSSLWVFFIFLVSMFLLVEIVILIFGSEALKDEYIHMLNRLRRNSSGQD
jgi:hypothetical protein